MNLIHIKKLMNNLKLKTKINLEKLKIDLVLFNINRFSKMHKIF